MTYEECRRYEDAVKLLDQLVSDKGTADDKIESLQERVENLEIELRDANRRIEDLERQLAERVVELTPEALFERLAAANRENARLRAELDDARTAYAFLAAERGPTLAEFCESLAARIDAAEQAAARENAAACRASPSDFPGREREAWEWLETAKRLRWALGQARAFMAGVR